MVYETSHRSYSHRPPEEQNKRESMKEICASLEFELLVDSYSRSQLTSLPQQCSYYITRVYTSSDIVKTTVGFKTLC